MDSEHILNTAIAAATCGAREINYYWNNLSGVEKKGDIDLVTVADLKSEKQILSVIQSAFKTHGIIAEESGSSNPESPHQWIIDPLDGTTNFAHGLPISAISIAYAFENTVTGAVVYNPIMQELFTARRGHGATLNGRPIGVSASGTIQDSLLATGFPYNFNDYHDEIMNRLSRCLKVARGVRRMGSAAIDLCYVACGRFDGFWEQNLKPWDTAAGTFIASEAGAVISDFSGNSYDIYKPEVLVTNGNIHSQMIELVKRA